MRLPGFDKRLEPAYKELARALSKLDEDHGLVGRRNTRQAASKALKQLQRKIDHLYPAQRRKASRRKRRTPRERVQHLHRQGWKHVSARGALELLAATGIRVERVRFPTESRYGADGYEVLAPAWAVDIASMIPKKLEAAKRSIRERRAVLVELSLKSDEKR